MNEHAWLEHVPAFVLDALDPDDRAAFAAHLEVCARCFEEVRAYREVAAGLASLSPTLEPPEGLRARVLARATRERPGRAEPGPSGARPEPEDAADAGGRGATEVTPLRRGRDRLPRLPWLAAAASLALAAVGVGAYLRARADREAVAGRYREALAQIADLELARAQRDSLLSTLAGADVRTATLTSTARDPRLRVFWNRESDVLLVMAFDLPPAPSGRVYQLWGLAPGSDPVSLAVFETDAAGRSVHIQPLAVEGEFAQSAVSEEPAGGSPQPTTQPFLIGSWSAAQE